MPNACKSGNWAPNKLKLSTVSEVYNNYHPVTDAIFGSKCLRWRLLTSLRKTWRTLSGPILVQFEVWQILVVLTDDLHRQTDRRKLTFLSSWFISNFWYHYPASLPEPTLLLKVEWGRRDWVTVAPLLLTRRVFKDNVWRLYLILSANYVCCLLVTEPPSRCVQYMKPKILVSQFPQCPNQNGPCLVLAYHIIQMEPILLNYGLAQYMNWSLFSSLQEYLSLSSAAGMFYIMHQDVLMLFHSDREVSFLQSGVIVWKWPKRWKTEFGQFLLPCTHINRRLHGARLSRPNLFYKSFLVPWW